MPPLAGGGRELPSEVSTCGTTWLHLFLADERGRSLDPAAPATLYSPSTVRRFYCAPRAKRKLNSVPLRWHFPTAEPSPVAGLQTAITRIYRAAIELLISWDHLTCVLLKRKFILEKSTG
jgi:hypothetical protein